MTLLRQKNARQGAVAALAALLLIPMLALVALCVDYGYLLVVRTDLQRAADAAALASVRDLIPTANGSQDFDACRATIREYAAENMNDEDFSVPDKDIEIGRFDPDTIYTDVTLLNDGICDTVRVTLRRDATANSPVSLFFARVIGINETEVTATATAVLQKARNIPPGSDILPIAIPQDTWNAQIPGDEWSIYGDGRVVDDLGNTVPGNWGTLDVGPAGNSTADLRDQINNGLRQSDLDAMYSQDRTDSSEYIRGTEQFWANADTGISIGMKSAVKRNHGATKLVPIVSGNNGGNGNNLEYFVVGWGVVQLVDSYWSGGDTQRHVTVAKAYMYDKDLAPHPDLSSLADIIPAAYTSPVLVE